jgi:hypothetical protein
MPKYKVGDNVWWNGLGAGSNHGVQFVTILSVTNKAPYLYSFNYDDEHDQQIGKLAESVLEKYLGN